MSTHEVVIALRFLRMMLMKDEVVSITPGGSWPGSVPKDKPVPYVIYGSMSAPDTLTANGVRLITRPLYQVRASGPASSIDAVALVASVIDDVLKDTKNTSVDGGLVAASYREAALQIDQPVNGVPWISIGGLYRLVIQQVPT